MYYLKISLHQHKEQRLTEGRKEGKKEGKKEIRKKRMQEERDKEIQG
jgi:hypothetical protein